MGVKARFIDKDYGEWWAEPMSVISGQGHKKRFISKTRISLNEVKRRLKRSHSDTVSINEDSYVSLGKKCEFIDVEYGSWIATPANIAGGHCHPKRALANRKATWIKKYGVDNPFKSDEVQMRCIEKCHHSQRILHWKTQRSLVCTASYEVAFVNWCNKNCIDFDWQIVHVMPNGKKYRIDAFIKDGEFADNWIEIKGYFHGDAREKWEWFHNEHPDDSQLWTETMLKKIGIL